MKINNLQFNLATDKKNNIASNLKNKAGIYQWVNCLNGKKYVGSSDNLKRRFLEYLNPNRLNAELKRGESIIYKALLKYGYKSFEFKILEIIPIPKGNLNSCSKQEREVFFKFLKSQEQIYLDVLNKEPEKSYNILSEAGTNRGHTLSLETREKMSLAKKGKVSHRKGSIHSSNSKVLMSLNSSVKKKVYIFDIKKALINIYPSITDCSAALSISRLRIRTAIKKKTILDNKYYISHNTEV